MVGREEKREGEAAALSDQRMDRTWTHASMVDWLRLTLRVRGDAFGFGRCRPLKFVLGENTFASKVPSCVPSPPRCPAPYVSM